ncbi:MAG: FCD domain-containing protein [Thermoplasmatales archaeon]
MHCVDQRFKPNHHQDRRTFQARKTNSNPFCRPEWQVSLSYLHRFGNAFLSKIVGDIRLRLKIVRITLFTIFNRRRDDFSEHKSVFNAIKDKKPSLAKELMIDH